MAYYDVFGEVLVQELVENEERDNLRTNLRMLRDNCDPFQLPPRQFKQVFRFSKPVARIIIDSVKDYMQQGQRTTFIPEELKILVTLNFLATGSYQMSLGQGYNFSMRMRIIYNNLLNMWIVFPDNPQRRNHVREGFMQKFNFPRCLGAIDCTHIAIISPPENYPALPYYCRKGLYSINCQIIVDSDYNILNMNARFPGSTHDSAIWQASNIKGVMENLYINGDDSFLIGDSGYPLQPFLITPIDNPEDNTPESNYNYHFIRARNSIEKLNGVLKSRFRCLLKHRVLNYDPIKAGKIIYSCGVLHNISQHYKDELPNDEMLPDDEENGMQDDILGEPILENINFLRHGVAVRNQVVEQYFNAN